MKASALATAAAYVGLSLPHGRRAGTTGAEAAVSMGALPLASEPRPAGLVVATVVGRAGLLAAGLRWRRGFAAAGCALARLGVL